MKPFLLLFLFLTGSLFGANETRTGAVYVIPVRSAISDQQAVFLRRAVKEAERQGASAIVLEMDTLGGQVSAAMDEMDTLLKTTVPTYTFINNKAVSAGALITLATRHIYMAPGAIIGAAAPVTGGVLEHGQDLETTMKEKVVSMVSGVARGAAQKCGHNPDLADAFVRKESVFKVGQTQLDGPDTLLTLDAEQATRKFDGKPVLAEGLANSLEEVIRLAGLSGGIYRVNPTGFERIAIWLTDLAPILLIIGMLGAYVEIKTPGFGLPGIVSIGAFTLFFAGSYLAGLAGWEAVIIFVIGLIFVLSELFVHPGTVLPGLIGIFLMLLSLIWAMVDRFPNDPVLPTSAMLLRPLLNLCVAVIGSSVAMYFLAKYLPRTRLFRSIVLEEVNPRGASLDTKETARVLPGTPGKARTTLRPSGKAEFGGHVFDVVSVGEFIPSGQSVRVVTVEGARVVVEAT